ncbi:MAG TPA: Gfo/Idh/MocA family oxidoreductase [Pirellulales bacterium]|jgi:predicted dehydrogenase|nr:Gfo/Idh/MocA family oxidoreductase [Pirellulales bacterium]
MKQNAQPTSGTTRRDFVKGSTAAAVGASLLGGLSISQTAYAAGDETIKIALIGCGGRGTGACSQALHNKTGGVKLIAMADAFKDHLESSLNNLKGEPGLAEKIDVPEERRFVGFDAYKKALEAGPDLVILATPPGFRPIHFEAAVNAGKNIFMEKPVATDAGGIRRVLAAAEESKKKNLAVGVGLQRHHQQPYIDIMQQVHDGAIGDITSMRVYWNGTTPWIHPRAELEKQYGRKLTEMEYQLRNWYYFTWICGDHIVEQHIHNLDVAAWAKNGYPIRANGMGGCEVRKGKDTGETFDHHCVEFEYADGSRVFSQCRHIPNTWESVSEYATGTKGTADLSGHSLQKYDGSKWKANGGGGNPYQVEHDDLFASIRAGKPYNEAERGAKSTFMAIFGRMATYSGRVVHWDEALAKGTDIMPKNFAWDASMPVNPDAEGMYPRAVPGKTKVIG